MNNKFKLACLLGVLLGLLCGCQDKVTESIEIEESTVELDVQTQIYTWIEDMEYELALIELEKQDIEVLEGVQEHYRLMGICQIGLGAYEEAVQTLEYALSTNEGYITELDFDTNYYLAVAYTKTGYYEKAKAVYEAIIALEPKETEAYYLNGVTHLYMGRVDEALVWFDGVADLEADNFDRLVEIYQVLDSFGYANFGREYLQEAVDNKTQDDDLNKGKMYYYLGDYQNAVLFLEQAMDAKDMKQASEVSLYLGMSYEALGDLNYAAKVYESGIALYPTAALYNQLGLCQLQRESYEAALEAFDLGLACNDSMFQKSLRFNKIVVLEHMGDFEQAKLLLEDYLKDYQSDQRAAREYEFLKTR